MPDSNDIRKMYVTAMVRRQAHRLQNEIITENYQTGSDIFNQTMKKSEALISAAANIQSLEKPSIADMLSHDEPGAISITKAALIPRDTHVLSAVGRQWLGNTSTATIENITDPVKLYALYLFEENSKDSPAPDDAKEQTVVQVLEKLSQKYLGNDKNWLKKHKDTNLDDLKAKAKEEIKFLNSMQLHQGYEHSAKAIKGDYKNIADLDEKFMQDSMELEKLETLALVLDPKNEKGLSSENQKVIELLRNNALEQISQARVTIKTGAFKAVKNEIEEEPPLPIKSKDIIQSKKNFESKIKPLLENRYLNKGGNKEEILGVVSEKLAEFETEISNAQQIEVEAKQEFDALMEIAQTVEIRNENSSQKVTEAYESKIADIKQKAVILINKMDPGAVPDSIKRLKQEVNNLEEACNKRKQEISDAVATINKDIEISKPKNFCSTANDISSIEKAKEDFNKHIDSIKEKINEVKPFDNQDDIKEAITGAESKFLEAIQALEAHIDKNKEAITEIKLSIKDSVRVKVDDTNPETANFEPPETAEQNLNQQIATLEKMKVEISNKTAPQPTQEMTEILGNAEKLAEGPQAEFKTAQTEALKKVQEKIDSVQAQKSLNTAKEEKLKAIEDFKEKVKQLPVEITAGNIRDAKQDFEFKKESIESLKNEAGSTFNNEVSHEDLGFPAQETSLNSSFESTVSAIVEQATSKDINFSDKTIEQIQTELEIEVQALKEMTSQLESDMPVGFDFSGASKKIANTINKINSKAKKKTQEITQVKDNLIAKIEDVKPIDLEQDLEAALKNGDIETLAEEKQQSSNNYQLEKITTYQNKGLKELSETDVDPLFQKQVNKVIKKVEERQKKIINKKIIRLFNNELSDILKQTKDNSGNSKLKINAKQENLYAKLDTLKNLIKKQPSLSTQQKSELSEKIQEAKQEIKQACSAQIESLNKAKQEFEQKLDSIASMNDSEPNPSTEEIIDNALKVASELLDKMDPEQVSKEKPGQILATLKNKVDARRTSNKISHRIIQNLNSEKIDPKKSSSDIKKQIETLKSAIQSQNNSPKLQSQDVTKIEAALNAKISKLEIALASATAREESQSEAKKEFDALMETAQTVTITNPASINDVESSFSQQIIDIESKATALIEKMNGDDAKSAIEQKQEAIVQLKTSMQQQLESIATKIAEFKSSIEEIDNSISFDENTTYVSINENKEEIQSQIKQLKTEINEFSQGSPDFNEVLNQVESVSRNAASQATQQRKRITAKDNLISKIKAVDLEKDFEKALTIGDIETAREEQQQSMDNFLKAKIDPLFKKEIKSVINEKKQKLGQIYKKKIIPAIEKEIDEIKENSKTNAPKSTKAIQAKQESLLEQLQTLKTSLPQTPKVSSQQNSKLAQLIEQAKAEIKQTCTAQIASLNKAKKEFEQKLDSIASMNDYEPNQATEVAIDSALKAASELLGKMDPEQASEENANKRLVVLQVKVEARRESNAIANEIVDAINQNIKAQPSDDSTTIQAKIDGLKSDLDTHKGNGKIQEKDFNKINTAVTSKLGKLQKPLAKETAREESQAQAKQKFDSLVSDALTDITIPEKSSMAEVTNLFKEQLKIIGDDKVSQLLDKMNDNDKSTALDALKNARESISNSAQQTVEALKENIEKLKSQAKDINNAININFSGAGSIEELSSLQQQSLEQLSSIKQEVLEHFSLSDTGELRGVIQNAENTISSNIETIIEYHEAVDATIESIQEQSQVKVAEVKIDELESHEDLNTASKEIDHQIKALQTLKAELEAIESPPIPEAASEQLGNPPLIANKQNEFKQAKQDATSKIEKQINTLKQAKKIKSQIQGLEEKAKEIFRDCSTPDKINAAKEEFDLHIQSIEEQIVGFDNSADLIESLKKAKEPIYSAVNDVSEYIQDKIEGLGPQLGDIQSQIDRITPSSQSLADLTLAQLNSLASEIDNQIKTLNNLSGELEEVKISSVPDSANTLGNKDKIAQKASEALDSFKKPMSNTIDQKISDLATLKGQISKIKNSAQTIHKFTKKNKIEPIIAKKKEVSSMISKLAITDVKQHSNLESLQKLRSNLNQQLINIEEKIEKIPGDKPVITKELKDCKVKLTEEIREQGVNIIKNSLKRAGKPDFSQANTREDVEAEVKAAKENLLNSYTVNKNYFDTNIGQRPIIDDVKACYEAQLLEIDLQAQIKQQQLIELEQQAKVVAEQAPKQIKQKAPILFGNLTDAKVEGFFKPQDSGEPKYQVSINCQNFIAKDLTKAQLQSLESAKGMEIQSHAGQKFEFTNASGNAQARLKKSEVARQPGEDATQANAKLADTLMTMMDNVIANGGEIHINTKDAMTAAICQQYIHFLKIEGGMPDLDASINGKDIMPDTSMAQIMVGDAQDSAVCYKDTQAQAVSAFKNLMEATVEHPERSGAAPKQSYKAYMQEHIIKPMQENLQQPPTVVANDEEENRSSFSTPRPTGTD